jgi:hypothetical protein
MRRNFLHSSISVFAALSFVLVASLAQAGPDAGTPCQIGKALDDGTFLFDMDDNGKWDGTATDARLNLALSAGDGIPFVDNFSGDVDGIDDGARKVGEKMIVDQNGNKVWDGTGGGDKNNGFANGITGTTPVSGDFGQLGNAQVGKFQSVGSRFVLDADGDNTWDGNAGGDLSIVLNASSGNGQGLVGNFNGAGGDNTAKKVGEKFFVDANGNNAWNGNAGGDVSKTFAGNFGPSIPLAADFNPEIDGDEIAKYVPSTSTFYIDMDHDYTWDGNAGGDKQIVLAASAGVGTPLVCDWDGDGAANVGKKVGDKYLIDKNGDNVWSGNGGGDRNTTFAAGAATTGGTGIAGVFTTGN